MKKELLIISNEQFGYHTDSFKYCQYLKDQYDITYLCFFKGQEKLLLEGVRVVYIAWQGSKLRRSFKYIRQAMYYMNQCKGLTFIIYFNGFSLFHLIMPWKKAILDIRTLSVSQNEKKRVFEDFFLKVTAKSFSYVTVISKGVIEKLGLSSHKAFLLPLGADVISEKEKKFESLNLLYVGTLNGRNILDTVKGFHLFLREYANKLKMSYDIVGDGQEMQLIKEYVKENKLDEVVKIHGYIHHRDLTFLVERCNIGVSYVPMTIYYENQPATKTYEYISSGLFTIATNTLSNQEVIRFENGLLINDTPLDFKNALKQTFLKLPHLNSKLIKESLPQCRWENIITNYLLPVLKRAGG